ncbi:MAG TPA: indole-3-glycerol phosphate synthase TrpC [Microbacteriaceae bacterium]|nr:indole-3-glycerol phosphate synthase TrpC [Microbacteriaceae bacterium]
MLESLLAGSLEDSLNREKELPFDQLMQEIENVPPALDAVSWLKPEGYTKVIAEVKRASPSRGDLAEIASPAKLAKEYELGGASIISVLTEERKFKGSLADLISVRKNVSVPILRKDFTANKYQIAEARLAGADLVLLIVAALDVETLKELYAFTVSLGMTALVEAHSAEEVQIAADLGAKLIGVNARNLKTFELDRELFGRVAGLIPQGSIKIAESAVLNVDDVKKYREAGADAVLVGEALATADDPRQAVKKFISVK